MSGRNRRRTPPAAAELRSNIAGLLSKLHRVEIDYRWLHASGYTKPHAKSGQIGDPADLLTGDPAAVRHQLIRAAEAIDDAVDAVARAGASLAKIESRLDESATPGGIDEDLPTASSAEVRHARKAQEKRNARAAESGSPFAFQEVTG